MYYSTPAKILAVKKFFRENPTGKIPTGMWNNPSWDAQEFNTWFLKCLNLKTGGTELNEKDWDLIRDARVINEYYGQRIVRSGCNILRSKKMQERYPHINTPSTDY